MNPFKDIQRNDWYYSDIRYVCENGLMIGTGEDIFAPDAALTRAMLVTILWRAAGQPAADDSADFRDVPAGQCYSDAIAWASANGIVLGYGDGIFGTNDSITRQQLAVILYRYEQHLGGGFKGIGMYHPDAADLVDVSDWAYEAVCWMAMKNIYVLREENRLAPRENATRAEAAAFLHSYSIYRKKSGVA